jgi:hypothetical protein
LNSFKLFLTLFEDFTAKRILKLSQNKKGQHIFYLHRFWNPFSQLPAVKKNSKNGAARTFFGPSYFDPALE